MKLSAAHEHQMATLDYIRGTVPTIGHVQELINAVAYVCSEVRGADVSLVQDLLDEASGAMEQVYALEAE